VGFSIFDELTILNNYAEFNGPGGTGNQLFFSSSPRRCRIDAIMARNPDSIDHILRFGVSTDGDGVTVGEVVVPAGSGVGVLPPVDCLTVIAPPQIGAFLVPVNSHFDCNLLDALVDAVELDVIITRGEF
jgi:hypothetical protein